MGVKHFPASNKSLDTRLPKLNLKVCPSLHYSYYLIFIPLCRGPAPPLYKYPSSPDVGWQIELERDALPECVSVLVTHHEYSSFICSQAITGRLWAAGHTSAFINVAKLSPTKAEKFPLSDALSAQLLLQIWESLSPNYIK